MPPMSAQPMVLIVEDQIELTKLLVNLLRRAGYDTSTATNCDEALAQAAARRPDLALLDLTLPGRDGIGVLQELHVLDPELPAIILTGNGSPDRARAALSNGAFDFFTKPFDSGELLARIADALANRLAHHHGLAVASPPGRSNNR